MKNNTRINKIYNEVFSKDKYYTPYFIEYDHVDQKGYLVYKIRGSLLGLFKTKEEAVFYIYCFNLKSPIITIDFHKKR